MFVVFTSPSIFLGEAAAGGLDAGFVVSFAALRTSFSMPFMASLNSLIPFPNPFARSGILLEPINKNETANIHQLKHIQDTYTTRQAEAELSGEN